MKLPSLFRKRVETAAETITLADHAQVVLRLQNQLAETTADPTPKSIAARAPTSSSSARPDNQFLTKETRAV